MIDLPYAKKLLDILIENSQRILECGFGVDRAESTFFDIVDLLRNEEMLREYFLGKVKCTLSTKNPRAFGANMISTELIELVAHELRWNELLDLANERLSNFFKGRTDLAMGDISTNLYKAFDNNWEDRDFYKHYKPKSR